MCLNEVRLMLGNFFGNGSIFEDWERKYGVLSDKERSEEEAVDYYLEVIKTIKNIFEEYYTSSYIDSVMDILIKYITSNDLDYQEWKNEMLIALQKKEWASNIDDPMFDTFYNNLLEAVEEDVISFGENYSPDDLNASEEILNTLYRYLIAIIFKHILEQY